MAFTVHIGTLDFSALGAGVEPFVSSEIEYNVKRDGKVYAKIERWRLHGFFVGDESTIAGNRTTLLNKLESGINDVIIKKGGSNHITLLQSDHENSPRFENYSEVGNPGLYMNHIEFFVDLVAEKAVQISGVVDVDTQITEEVNERGFEKRITIRATGPGAEAYVRGQKPSGGNVTTERITEMKETETWVAEYTVGDPNKKGSGDTSALEIEESITVSDGIRRINPFITDGDPILFRSGLFPATVTVSGTVRSTDKFLIAGDLFGKLRRLNREFKRDNLIGIDEGAVEVEEFIKPEKPKSFSRRYNYQFMLTQRIKTALFARFRVQDIVGT